MEEDEEKKLDDKTNSKSEDIAGSNFEEGLGEKKKKKNIKKNIKRKKMMIKGTKNPDYQMINL